MHKALFFFTLMLSVTSFNAQSQDLVNWRDLLDADVNPNYKRIQVGSDSLQFADLWLPDGDGPHQTVILVHGGCWLGIYPGVTLTHPAAEALSSEGYAVWNVEYRRLGQEGGGYPGTFLDVANAADYLRDISDDYNLDLSSIIAVGHSAGGHLVSWLAARENISDESELYVDNPLPISKVVSLAGINDLEEYARFGSSPCGDQTVEQLVSLDDRGLTAYSDTSPANLIPYSAKHYEVVAAFDRPVPPFLGRGYWSAVVDAGGDAELILQSEAGHYEMTAPWTEEWKQVLELLKGN
jgi:acetyl esterase/lipase